MVSQYRILIVDNDATFTDEFISKLYLDSNFFLVGVVQTFNNAIEILKNKNVDFILLDILGTDINNLDMLKKIKQAQPNAKCIIASFLISENIVNNALSLGAINYFCKPVDCEKILLSIMKDIVKNENIN